MTAGSFPLRNDVMLPSDAIESPPFEANRRTIAEPQLPFYVPPAAADEALISWLGRLASRFDLSAHQFAWQVFGLDYRGGPAQWWLRPSPLLLKRVSDRTGVPADQLDRMTLNPWAPPCWEDEADECFGPSRYRHRPSQRCIRYLAVCPDCLRDDGTPYLRLDWLIGWGAVCPRHGKILVSRCSSCNSKLRLAPYNTAGPLPPNQCATCGSSVLNGKELGHPHARVMAFHTALLGGKRLGIIDLDGIGRLSWTETMALADALLGTFWTRRKSRAPGSRAIFQRMGPDWPHEKAHDGRDYGSRYHSLSLLAWFLEGWPRSAGAKMAIELLVHWSRARRHRVSSHLDLTWEDPWDAGPHEVDPTSQFCVQRVLSRATHGTTRFS